VYRLKETDHWEDLRIKGRAIIILILKKYNGRLWGVFIWFRQGPLVDFDEYGHESSAFIHCVKCD
jgi:hypothetical protein